MTNPGHGSISPRERMAQLGGLLTLFASYEIATVLSLLYDRRDGGMPGGFAWLAVLIATIYYDVYRRFNGRDKWVLAFFIGFAAIAIILTSILFDAGSLIANF